MGGAGQAIYLRTAVTVFPRPAIITVVTITEAYKHSNKWRLKANVTNSSAAVLAKEAVQGILYT